MLNLTAWRASKVTFAVPVDDVDAVRSGWFGLRETTEGARPRRPNPAGFCAADVFMVRRLNHGAYNSVSARPSVRCDQVMGNRLSQNGVHVKTNAKGVRGRTIQLQRQTSP